MLKFGKGATYPMKSKKPLNRLEVTEDLLQVIYELEYLYRKSLQFDKRIMELEHAKFDLEDLLNECEKEETSRMAENPGNN